MVWLATGAVTLMDDVHWWLTQLKSDVGVPAFGPIPSADEWLAFYEDDASITDFIGKVIGYDLYGTSNVTLMHEALGQWDDLTSQERHETLESLSEEDHRAILDDARELAAWMLESSREAIQRSAEADESPLTGSERRMVESLPMQFLLRVWAPCLILYHESPKKLFRRAQANETSALEKLIRLDKAVLHDTTIADIIHQSFQAHKRPRFSTLGRAMAGRPIGKLSKGKIRSGIAGLISHVAHELGHKITAPEITELFDLVARAKGYASDRHLPKNPESMGKAIQRERPTWKL